MIGFPTLSHVLRQNTDNMEAGVLLFRAFMHAQLRNYLRLSEGGHISTTEINIIPSQHPQRLR